ncbi:MAG: DUF3048 domain-containing protein [Clostridia bacterium]|nr:DUF3048 domain-containing protein [Clostridia bacterium]
MKRKPKLNAVALLTVTAIIIGIFASCAQNAGYAGIDSSMIVSKKYATTDDVQPAPVDTYDQTEATTEATTVATTVATFVQPLTGLTSENDLSGTRPIAVIVDNSAAALAHQTGLLQADILYEALCAPGVTRFMAVIGDTSSLDDICNIASAGAVHVSWAANHNAVLICAGAHDDTNPYYDFYTTVMNRPGGKQSYIDTQTEPAWSAEQCAALGCIRFYSDGYRSDILYDTLLTSKALRATLNTGSRFTSAGGTLDGETKQLLKFGDGMKYDTAAATQIELTFSGEGLTAPKQKYVTYDYNKESGKYLRSQNGQPHVDADTGEQLSFDNLIVIGTDVKFVSSGVSTEPYVTDIKTTGTGTGYYFHGGECTEITWVGNDGELSFYCGNMPLTVHSGTTYIGFVDESSVSHTIWYK